MEIIDRYEKGNAVSNFVNRIDEPPLTASYLTLFDQIWNDAEKLEDVTERLCEHIASVYQENSPQRIYFLMLYNIFSEFLEDISATSRSDSSPCRSIVISPTGRMSSASTKSTSASAC